MPNNELALMALPVASGILLLLAACKADVTFVGVGHDTAPVDTGDGNGTVHLASVAVTASVHPADAAVATQLGWSSALVGAEVTLERVGSSASAQTRVTDANGRAEFSDVLPGSYRIGVLRPLSSSETEQLSATDADVMAFGGGTSVTVSAPTTTVPIAMSAGRRGSLIISEVYAAEPRLPSGGYYQTGHFLELYNNTDTVIFLDRKVVGVGQGWFRDYPSPRSCSEMQEWRDDPQGIWSRFFYRFPGSGVEHPLNPGSAVVIATDALDHRQFLQTLPDLSGAPFEFVGASDTDNPSSKNMVNIGPGEWAASVGKGLFFASIGMAVFVADDIDPATLVRDQLPVLEPDYLRIPRERLLDVFSTILLPEIDATLTRPCDQVVNALLDVQMAAIHNGEQAGRSLTRRVFTTLGDGRRVLLRTRTSSRDFQGLGQPTPDTILESDLSHLRLPE